MNNIFIERVNKESAINRLNLVPDYQLVDRYGDTNLVFNKKEVGYHSQFVKVGILKEGNLISFNKPNRRLKNEFNWYEPEFYTLEPESITIYLKYTELEIYELDKATEIINKTIYESKDKVAGYITDDGKAIYYDQYLGE